MLKIGLPKGIIKKHSLYLIEKMLGKEINKTKLYFTDEKKFSFYLLKHRDIPVFVNDNVLDFGITSQEWVLERGFNFGFVQPLDWCDTRISLISPEKCEKKETRQCITEFPNIAKKFIAESGSDMEIKYISGSTEGLVGSIFDCSIDCVETGLTLKNHNLQEEIVIFKSKVIMIKKNKPEDRNMDSFINEVLKMEDIKI